MKKIFLIVAISVYIILGNIRVFAEDTHYDVLKLKNLFTSQKTLSPVEFQLYKNEIIIDGINQRCKAEAFINIIKIGATDTLYHALYPSAYDSTKFTWDDFINESRKYIIEIENQRKTDYETGDQQIDTKNILISTNDKFSRTGVIMFESLMKGYINAKISYYENNIKECSDSDIPKIRSELSPFIENEIPRIATEVWARESIRIYKDYWLELNKALTEVISKFTKDINEMKAMYTKMASSISYLPKK